MILEFSVKNFRSIKEKQTFSLIPDSNKTKENLPQNIADIQNQPFLKTAVIYGPNASGKSNLLEAFLAFYLMVSESAANKKGTELRYYFPYKLIKKYENEPVEFEIELLINQIRYQYGFAYHKDEILWEYLYHWPKSHRALLFYRYSNGKQIKKGEYLKGSIKSIEKLLNPNQLFLSKAIQNNVESLASVYYGITDKLINLSIFNETNSRKLKRIAIAKIEDKGKDFRNRILSLLKSFDTGINDFNITEKDVSSISFPDDIPDEIKNEIIKDHQYDIHIKHTLFDKDNNNIGETSFNFSEESSGTQRLFLLAGIILDAMDEGNTLIFDEFERSIHPYIIKYIIKLFNDPEINKGNGQLIFTTHDVSQLDSSLLRKDQIWFTEKNSFEATELFSLADFDSSQIRKNGPFDKWYMSGRFGAIPAIDELIFRLNNNYEKENQQ